jgi:hypothetical protein
MDPLIVGGVVAAVVCSVALVALVLRVVARVRAKTLQSLAGEGFVMRSGPVLVTLRLSGHGSASMRSSAHSRRKAELVLTKRGLSLVMPSLIRLGDAPFTDLQVKADPA